MAEDLAVAAVLKELEDCGARYFSFVFSSNSHTSSLEIPTSFTQRHGWPGEENCLLVTSVTTKDECPVQFHGVKDESGGLAFISIGTGWASFVSDHKLTIGAFLTFEVLDTACLAVAIHRRSSSPVSPPEVVDADIKPTRLVHRDLPEVGHARRRLSTQLPTTRVTHLHDSTAVDIPSFRKTLRKSHVLDVPSSRVDVPTAFWRKYGSCHFDDVWYWLSGPRAACTVDSATYFSGKQRQCFFTDGWASFCRANHLKLGDTLLFEKVGDIEYRVTKV